MGNSCTRFSFFALISRMRNIKRWSLMRGNMDENVQEHSHMVAVLAHALAVIRRDVFGRSADPGFVSAAALFHDASEILTGDLPTPVKYFNSAIRSAYGKVESVASAKLLGALPAELRPAYDSLLSPADPGLSELVKAADTLAAYIKCLEELRTGNLEFSRAASQTRAKLEGYNLREVTYFIERFIPAFELSLDELDFHFGEEN